MFPWAGQGATVVTAQMRGTSPSVLMAIEPLDEPFHLENWQEILQAKIEDVFGISGVEVTQVGSPNALEAISELLGHMFDDILLT